MLTRTPFSKNCTGPTKNRPPDKQDKRMVVSLNEDSYDAWLDASAESSREYFVQYPADRLVCVAVPPAKPGDLLTES